MTGKHIFTFKENDAPDYERMGAGPGIVGDEVPENLPENNIMKFDISRK
jgi:hypothetical protein